MAKSALEIPGAAEAVIGSKLGKRVIAECPSVSAMVADEAAVKALALAQPAIGAMIMDPRLSRAIEANPDAADKFKTVKATVSGAFSAPR